MSAKMRIGVVTVSAAIALYAIVGGFLWDRSATAKGNQWAQLRIFDEVLFHIVRDYVDEPDMERVRTGALRGLAEGLDPYSAYLTAAQASDYKPVDAGLQEVGGMVLSKVGGYLYVVSVFRNSPAENANIAAGDFIEYLGKVPTRDISLYDAEVLLTSQQSPTEMKLVRRGQAVVTSFAPGASTKPALDARILETGVGYVGVPSLHPGRAAEIRTAVEGLVAKGARRIVLDLRGASYGKLEEGTAVADLFIDSGVMARKIGRGGADGASYAAKTEDTIFRGPLSVVIDRTTAGAGEVIASAVLATKRGDVVGDKSFGAGVELELFKLRDGGALLMTTAKYAPASGKSFMEEPVTPSVLVARAEVVEPVAPDDDEETGDAPPDEEVPGAAKPTPKRAPKPTPAPAPADDVQVKKAVEVLKNKTEAPAAARAA